MFPSHPHNANASAPLKMRFSKKKKDEVLFPDTRVMLTSCVHANLPHLKPLMFDVFCSFLLILLFGHAGPLLLCVGFSVIAGSEDYSLVTVFELLIVAFLAVSWA